MLKNLSSLQQRIITGIVLLVLVGFIGWVDNFFVMWVFLGTIYMFGNNADDVSRICL